MNRKILCVDDEANVLSALERHLRKRFDLTTAVGPMEGLRVIGEDAGFAVVVSDLRMPSMDGIEFLSRVKATVPSSVRVMLTGYGDFHTAMAAVNEGSVFRFLTKPCPPETLATALESCVEQFRLQTLERDLLERTVCGSIELVSEILSLAHPAIFSRSLRIRRLVQRLVRQLGWKDSWQFEVAAMLSQIGCITLPTEVLDRAIAGEPLSDTERHAFQSYPAVGRDLLVNIPRFELIAEMVATHRHAAWSQSVDGSDPIMLGALALRIAAEFDDLRVKGRPFPECIAALKARRVHDPGMLAALEKMAQSEFGHSVRLVRIGELNPGMTLDQDVLTKTGLFLVARGNQATPSLVARLKAFAACQGIAEPLRVTVELGPLEGSATAHET